MKLWILYGSPAKDDLRYILDLPEILDDEILQATLSVTKLNKPSREIEERLNILLRLFNREELTSNLFFTMRGRVSFEREEIVVPTRKAQKYSGYVKNISSLGPKRSRQVPKDPEIAKWDNKLSFNFVRFLTVGEFSTGQPGGSSFTLKSSKRAKR